MGEALFDLEEVLTSKGKLTLQEANILESCKSKAVRDFDVGALAGGTATWAATWKLRRPFRITLSAGAGAFCGLWIFYRSLYSSADQILTMDGSILQKELANIMVKKYKNDPSLMQLISKHFYFERIFDDSTSNNPKLRLRHRNFFSDNAVHGHRIHDHESNDNSQEHSHNDSNDKSQGGSENVTNSKRTTTETKQTFKNESPDIMREGDPLDCVFGYAPTPVEEIHHSNKQSGIHNRAHRRSHRRRRMRNHEDLPN